MGTFLELARSRRSVRKYKPDEIDPKALERILEAGRLAPSGNNSQPWRFIVVRDEKIKKQLFEAAGKQKWILEAPVTIAVIGDITAKMKRTSFVSDEVSIKDAGRGEVLVKTVRDAAIAAEHIVMAATDEGLGTCWIALFEQDDIRPVLKVPENCYVLAIITLGHADESPKARPRHALNDIVFEDQFGRCTCHDKAPR